MKSREKRKATSRKWALLTDAEFVEFIGSRCDEFEVECFTCQKWARRDYLCLMEHEDAQYREEMTTFIAGLDALADEVDEYLAKTEPLDNTPDPVNLTDMLDEIRVEQDEEYKKAKTLGIDLMLNRKIKKPKRKKGVQLDLFTNR